MPVCTSCHLVGQNEIVVKILRGGKMIPIAISGVSLEKGSPLETKDLKVCFQNFLSEKELTMAEEELRRHQTIAFDSLSTGETGLIITRGVSVKAI